MNMPGIKILISLFDYYFFCYYRELCRVYITSKDRFILVINCHYSYMSDIKIFISLFFPLLLKILVNITSKISSVNIYHCCLYLSYNLFWFHNRIIL